MACTLLGGALKVNLAGPCWPAAALGDVGALGDRASSPCAAGLGFAGAGLDGGGGSKGEAADSAAGAATRRGGAAGTAGLGFGAGAGAGLGWGGGAALAAGFAGAGLTAAAGLSASALSALGLELADLAEATDFCDVDFCTACSSSIFSEQLHKRRVLQVVKRLFDLSEAG